MRRGFGWLAVGISWLALGGTAQATNYVVDSPADSGTGSLREAVGIANGNAGPDSISFDPGVTGTITLTGGSLSISGPLEIVGPGPDDLAVSGNNGSRILSINSVADPGVAISGLRFTDGEPGDCGCGGAIVNFATHLEISDSVFDHNKATWGGAIESYQAGLEILNSTFSSNSGDHEFGGGAVHVGEGKVEIRNSTFSANTDVGRGGALSLGATRALIENSTITANTVNGLGGGVASDDAGKLTVVSSTIAGNEADKGGGVYHGKGKAKLRNTLVADNLAGKGADVFSKGLKATFSLFEVKKGAKIKGSHNIFKKDPDLEAIADNGGPTATMALPDDSKAIDKGNGEEGPGRRSAWFRAQRQAGHRRLRAQRHALSDLIEAINSQAAELEEAAGRDLEPWAERLAGCRRFWLIGTGSSQHCAELGALMFQEAGLEARWASASQFVRWLPPPRTGDGVIVISHTGKTAFAAAARQRALDSGVAVASITGIGSGWAEAFETVPQERSETHTVSYTTALLALVRLAAQLGASGPKPDEISRVILRVRDLVAGGPTIELPTTPRLLALAGAGPTAITAREGALKVREASRTLAEGFEAEYLLHGSAVPLGAQDALLLLQPGLDPDGLAAAVGEAAEAEGIFVVSVDEPALEHRVLDQIPLTVRLQLLAAELAARNGTNPDQVITGHWADERLWRLGRPAG